MSFFFFLKENAMVHSIRSCYPGFSGLSHEESNLNDFCRFYLEKSFVYWSVITRDNVGSGAKLHLVHARL